MEYGAPGIPRNSETLVERAPIPPYGFRADVRCGLGESMSYYRRAYVPGGCYFFTAVTWKRKPLLVRHIDRLREAFRKAKTAQPFEIDAIVVFPDHLHCIWQLPFDDADYSTRWKRIKQEFNQQFVCQFHPLKMISFIAYPTTQQLSAQRSQNRVRRLLSISTHKAHVGCGSYPARTASTNPNPNEAPHPAARRHPTPPGPPAIRTITCNSP
uniref:Transposase IS200 like n=1 Tax=Candidatus Kentrum sp. LFY TaxID=2126342 RepID=A0A450X609_9GAMM|nr:MAG: Transposase IS200 like [Candidatus Kentron sp. LFY]